MSTEDTHRPTVENMMKLFGLNEEQALAAVQSIEATKQQELHERAVLALRDGSKTLRDFLDEFDGFSIPMFCTIC